DGRHLARRGRPAAVERRRAPRGGARRDATDLRLLAAIGDRTVCRLGPWGRRRGSAEEERLLLLLFGRSLLLKDVGVADDGDLLLGQPALRHHGGAGSRAHRGAELTVDLVGDVS